MFEKWSLGENIIFVVRVIIADASVCVLLVWYICVTVIQLNESDTVVLPLLSTAHKVLTGVLLQFLWINNPLLLYITE